MSSEKPRQISMVKVDGLVDLPAGAEGLDRDHRQALLGMLRGDSDGQVAAQLRVPSATVGRWRREELAPLLVAGQRERLERAARVMADLTPEMVQILASLARDDDAPAGARGVAARTVLEFAEKLAVALSGRPGPEAAGVGAPSTKAGRLAVLAKVQELVRAAQGAEEGEGPADG